MKRLTMLAVFALGLLAARSRADMPTGVSSEADPVTEMGDADKECCGRASTNEAHNQRPRVDSVQAANLNLNNGVPGDGKPPSSAQNIAPGSDKVRIAKSQ